METDIAADASLWEWIRHLSLSVWVAGGVLLAALYWFLKWAVAVLFVQGKGISLITVPVSRMAGRIIEDKFAQRLADSKLLPKLYPPTDWDEFNRFTGYIADRMRTYRELIYQVQAKFSGPSAVTLRLTVRYFEPDFVETFRTAERGFRDLDRIDAEMRALHRALHVELEGATMAMERERIALDREFEMARIKLKSLIDAQRHEKWLLRTLMRPVSALVRWIWGKPEIRALRQEKKEAGAKLSEMRKALKEKHREIFAAHHAEVLGVCLELIEHDQQFLKHLYFRFGLEMESLTFTVASGRILELLTEETEAAALARRELELDDLAGFANEALPIDIHAMRSHIRADPDLETYVGLGPEAVLEGALEPYLRIKLLLGKLHLPGYSEHWVAHLPPPAEFGRAQAEYNHFPHQLAWLKKPLPGLEVADNGLVIFAKDTGPELHAAE